MEKAMDESTAAHLLALRTILQQMVGVLTALTEEDRLSTLATFQRAVLADLGRANTGVDDATSLVLKADAREHIIQWFQEVEDGLRSAGH